jgi:hypothetical protein
VKDAWPWVLFLIGVPFVLWMLTGGLKVYMDDTEHKIQACREDGGFMTKYMQCVKWSDLGL